MRLIDDQRIILPEEFVMLHLGQQYAVRHDLDISIVADMIAEADFVTHRRARLHTQLLGNTR